MTVAATTFYVLASIAMLLVIAFSITLIVFLVIAARKVNHLHYLVRNKIQNVSGFVSSGKVILPVLFSILGKFMKRKKTSD